MSIQRFIESRPTNARIRALLAHLALQVGLDVREEDDVGVGDASRQLRLEVGEDVELRVVGVAVLRSYSYPPAQKNVLPPATRSTSSMLTPRACRTAYSSSPKSSPTGPTTCTSAKKHAARAKCTAEPPSRRSRCPHGVSTASKAMDPTTVTLIRARKGIGRS